MRGLVILKHECLRPITNEECIQALPKEWSDFDRQFVSISDDTLRLDQLYSANQRQIAFAQRSYFNAHIRSKIDSLSGYKILYFGLAPIPLAINLGYQLHNFRDIDVFQFHHKEKKWYQNVPARANSEFQIDTFNIPDARQKGICEVVLRLSISHSVKPEDTQILFPNSAEIDIKLSSPNEDAITSKEELESVAEKFKEVMDQISNTASKIEIVHLFASIPVGVAFLIGTKISPNIHPFVQTYQYSNTESPKHIPAVLIKEEANSDRILTDSEIEVANELRKLCNDELNNGLRTFANENENASRGRSWYLGLMPLLSDSLLREKFWANLPAICETSLSTDEIDCEVRSVDNGFSWNKGKWCIDDLLFISLNTRIKNTDDIRRAIRLFLFHEALHFRKHKLTSATANNIGSFPKVLETADYQADVYALFNEYAYSLKDQHSIKSPKEFFLHSIDIATETMWSFDDGGKELEELQIRRVSRYLIWYWQYVKIEKAKDDLNEIVKILEDKPVLELNGLKTKELNNRFYYDLNKRNSTYLELAIFRDNEVIRHGSASNMVIEDLVQGLRRLDGTLIKNVLKSFLDA